MNIKRTQLGHSKSSRRAYGKPSRPEPRSYRQSPKDSCILSVANTVHDVSPGLRFAGATALGCGMTYASQATSGLLSSALGAATIAPAAITLGGLGAISLKEMGSRRNSGLEKLGFAVGGAACLGIAGSMLVLGATGRGPESSIGLVYPIFSTVSFVVGAMTALPIMASLDQN